MKEAGGASVDDLLAFADAALLDHGITDPNPEAWKKTFATFMTQSNTDDYPRSKYMEWLAADQGTRREREKEARNWAGAIVSELPESESKGPLRVFRVNVFLALLDVQDTATRAKNVERIVSTATQLTDQRRCDGSTASKLTEVLNKCIRDCGGTEELKRAYVRDMRSSIESLNRAKKSTLKGALYKALSALVNSPSKSERIYSECLKIGTFPAYKTGSRRTRTRPSRPEDEDSSE
jgi:hypothetical protein